MPALKNHGSAGRAGRPDHEHFCDRSATPLMQRGAARHLTVATTLARKMRFMRKLAEEVGSPFHDLEQ